jgi:hypothetical protein
LDKLKASLTQFCTQGLRRNYWQHATGPHAAQRSLWTELQRALDVQTGLIASSGVSLEGLPGPELACAAIAVAAETVVSRLQAKPDDLGSAHGTGPGALRKDLE